MKGVYGMGNDHKHKKVQITTGPFLIAEEVGPDIQFGRNLDRLVIILKNPTKKKLKAKVTLGVCLQPASYPHDDSNTSQYRVFDDIHEHEFSLGTHELKPHTCTRIERDIPTDLYGYENSTNERNAVYRVTAKGDFNICDQTCDPICGLLEISVVAGSVALFDESGLEQADASTFFRYKDFVFCEVHEDDHDDDDD